MHGVTMKFIQPTLPTSPDLCKNVSLHCYLVAAVIRIQSVHSQIGVYIYTYSSQHREAGREQH